jgi:hypothetical protein
LIALVRNQCYIFLIRKLGFGPREALPGPVGAGLWLKDDHLKTSRNEKAVKPLKTNNPAKCRFGTHNDFNALRPALRKDSFRLAKGSFRFRGLLAESRPETQRAESGPRFDGLSWRGATGRRKARLSTGRRATFPESLRSQRRKRQTAFTVSLGLVSRRSTGGPIA